jgi:hypothetical protein
MFHGAHHKYLWSNYGRRLFGGGIAHVGVEGASDDGQGSDVVRGHLFCQDLCETCE